MTSWHEHPATKRYGKVERSLGERAADAIRNGMGSWTFVFASLVFLGIWMYFNQDGGFDPFPFILLNLVLSCVAALQGAILLIAAKREDQINSELAVHTFQVDQENLELTKQVHELSLRIEQLTQEVHKMLKEKN
ncbi:MAG: hypothetical protein RLZ65_769 [Actinomycetota bacterium]|jgi:uncharacterized membrane protein